MSNALQNVVAQVGRVVLGKQHQIKLALACLLSRGHLLIEDLPGVGKTTLAHALAKSLGLQFHRIQFTSDMLPADIIGVSVYDRDGKAFRFHPGPIFAQVVLADEVNRATPKTQSALLEAMEEHQVTIEGVTHALPEPFFVIATQNPSHQIGTFPLPESQLDRFLMRVSVGYPSPDAELEILDTHGDHDPLREIRPVVTQADVQRMSAASRKVHVAPSLKAYLVELAQATRRSTHLALGISPRATLALQRVARARAASQGRGYVVPDDIKALAVPVLAHRLVVTPEAQLQGVTAADVLAEVLRAVPVPTGAR